MPRHSPCALSNLTCYGSLFVDILTLDEALPQDLLSVPFSCVLVCKTFFFASLCPLISSQSIFPYAVVKVQRFHLETVRSLGAGGDNEARTRDLLLARQALSQLSYAPVGSRERALKIEQ